MSRQRDILPKVLETVRKNAPGASVFLSGSVCFGHERPDSDIDLVVIVPDITVVRYPGGQVRDRHVGLKFVDATFEGIPLEIIFLTPRAFTELVGDKPWRGYKFLRVEILFDPQGLIQSWKGRIAPWFDDHPDAVELWQQWLAEHSERQVTRGKKLGDVIRKFPDMMSDLWPYLDHRFGKRRVTCTPSAGVP